ncbi:ead/Ea22-like family protein [Enterobacter oligotrophicus]|uniref:ead/Ea22-like family protein n=1 Tax=Enterobacter oligotrophicus TaxID=2478464 RepID=UPI0028AE943D|nr:ead/Ea22-like family protein [Enterobacter oligotrophicus]
MSNIDKQALREIAAAAVGAHERLSVMPTDDIFDISLAEGAQLDADITALNALNAAANPATVLALLDENESMARDLISRNGEIEGLRQRIAELEVRDKPKFVQCWSCKHDIEVLAIADCDGYCPRCAAPIDLDDEPYAAAGKGEAS